MLDHRNTAGIVLIVDDVPENIAILHDALAAAGYTVFVATNGQSALDRIDRIVPDVILLDALMPGIDGFETCRRIKSSSNGNRTPVIFMTGLTETEHILRGFEAGGIDYVTKPIRPAEVMARVATHLRNAKRTEQVERVLHAEGRALITIDELGRVLWQTVSDRDWLGPQLTHDGKLLERFHPALSLVASHSLTINTPASRVTFKRVSDQSAITLLVSTRKMAPSASSLKDMFGITEREADVLHWIACGKTNRDIAELVGMSPRTVDKHLQHIYTKLGVETRTAAASVALSR